MSVAADEYGYANNPAEGVQGEPWTPLSDNPGTRGYVASMQVLSGAGILFGFSGYNSGPAQWILVFDASGQLPADGATADIVIAVPTLSNFSASWGTGRDGGRAMQRGIWICNSTTSPTKTIGAANCWFDVQYL